MMKLSNVYIASWTNDAANTSDGMNHMSFLIVRSVTRKSSQSGRNLVELSQYIVSI